MDEQSEKSWTPWHTWFENLLGIPLRLLGVDVRPDHPMMAGPPKADIIIMRKGGEEWTPEQMRLLPDGVRQSRASRIIIEFKHGQSVNEDTLFQTAGYRTFHKLSNKLGNEELDTFLVSSRMPLPSTLREYGYLSEGPPGIFRGGCCLSRRITLISLNDLTEEPHNTLVMLLATKRRVRVGAMRAVRRLGGRLPSKLRSYVGNLLKTLFVMEGEKMDEIQTELTPEDMAEMIRTVEELIIPAVPAEEILSRFSDEEILSRFTPEDILSRYKTEERLAGLTPEDILSRYKTEERLAGLTPESRLAGLTPESRLAGLTPEEIEAYLKSLRQNEERENRPNSSSMS